MQINDNDILAQLERLAAAFPWDRVDLWVCREPEGAIKYSAIVHDNETFGFPFKSASSDTPEQAADKLIANAGEREPEKARDEKIAQLKDQIEKLLSVEIGLPPYRANRELAAHNGARNATVDVQAQVAAWEQSVKDNPPKRVI